MSKGKPFVRLVLKRGKPKFVYRPPRNGNPGKCKPHVKLLLGKGVRNS